MKIASAIFLSIILVSQAISQNVPALCILDAAETGALKQNTVRQQWEYKVDRKTKKKIFNSVCEYDKNGCMIKQIVPATNSENRTYRFYEWQYNEQGKLLTYSEGEIDSDSAQSYSFSERYNYNSAGIVSNYRKEFYEGLMSQTVDKWIYSYSGSGEKTELSFTKIIVRKDTISNDEIRYSGNGTPIERILNNYSPKGFSDYRKYDGEGLPVEYIRYEKEKIVSHKIYSYEYDKQGVLLEENVTDGIGKTNEKKKYEKDKVTYTLMNTKGKILKNTTEPYAPPTTISFPPLPVAHKQAEQTTQSVKNVSVKEKTDKNKNKIVEHYVAQKLVSSETYNSKGLLAEKNTLEAGFVLQYEYAVY